MEKKFYEMIQPIGEFNELEIEVHYEKGGMNYFTYKKERRGVYVRFKPIRRGNGSVTFAITGDTLTSGFKVLLKELGRKSEKWEQKAAELIGPMTKEFAKMYRNEEFMKVVKKAEAVGAMLN